MSTSSTGSSASGADLKSDVDSLKEDLSQLRDDIKSFASDAVHQGKAKAADAKDAAREKYDDSLDSVYEFVREKPGTALGIAFAVGAVAAMYMGRK